MGPHRICSPWPIVVAQASSWAVQRRLSQDEDKDREECRFVQELCLIEFNDHRANLTTTHAITELFRIRVGQEGEQALADQSFEE